MKLIIRLLITSITAFILGKYFLAGVQFDTFSTAIIFSIVLGLLNIFVKPVFQFFGAPITFLTLGFFSLVINTVIILITDYFVEGMTIDGFWSGFIFSILLSLITSLLNGIFSSK